jgi:hypothetical protein
MVLKSNKRARVVIALAACIALAGCASSNTKRDAGVIQLCEEPRRQLCTRDYRPVCAKPISDSQPDETAANACTACSSVEVRGYVEGECPSD